MDNCRCLLPESRKARFLIALFTMITACATAFSCFSSARADRTDGVSAPHSAAAAPGSAGSASGENASGLLLTDEKAEKMEGCEAVIEGDYIILRPKNNAAEGILWRPRDDVKYKKYRDEYYAVQKVLTDEKAEGKTLKIEGKIYGYKSLWRLFYQSPIKSLGNIDRLDVGNVTGMYEIFRDAKFISDLKPLAKWNVGNVTDFSYAFSGAKSLINPTGIENWDVSKAASLTYLFSESGIASLDAVKTWNTKNTENMRGLVAGCVNLSSLEPLAGWNTANVTNMQFLAAGCKNIKSLKGLEKWNTSKVDNLVGAFWQCADLNDISALAKWDVSKVKEMSGLFSTCGSLEDVSPLKNWQTQSLEKMDSIFENCTQLKNPDVVSHWDTSKVTDFGKAFDGVPPMPQTTVLDFSNKRITKDNISSLSALKDLQGVIIANNWQVDADAQAGLEAALFANPVKHIVVTDNETLLTKLKDVKYPKPVTLCAKGEKFSLYLPAVYDSRINGTGKPASHDAMAVVGPQVKAAIEGKIEELRKDRPQLNLAGDYLPPAESAAGESPLRLFQDYFPGVKEKIAAKMQYAADADAPYDAKTVVTPATDGEKSVITVVKPDGQEEIKETVLRKAVNGLTKVGSRKEIRGTDGSVTTEIYGVDPDTGALSAAALSRKTVKKGTEILDIATRVTKTKETIKAHMKYEADPSRTFRSSVTVTQAENGEKQITVKSYTENGSRKETRTEDILKPAREGLTKIGNAETTYETIGTSRVKVVKTYAVDPLTGVLGDVISTHKTLTAQTLRNNAVTHTPALPPARSVLPNEMPARSRGGHAGRAASAPGTRHLAKSGSCETWLPALFFLLPAAGITLSRRSRRARNRFVGGSAPLA